MNKKVFVFNATNILEINIKHDYLLEENCLAIISKILADNLKSLKQ